MLSNAYFLAKFRFGTIENEPAKNWQNFAKRIRAAAAGPDASTIPLGGQADLEPRGQVLLVRLAEDEVLHDGVLRVNLRGMICSTSVEVPHFLSKIYLIVLTRDS